MELEGNLSVSMTVADVLQFLGLGAMTGQLNLGFGDGPAVHLTMVQGRVCSISSQDNLDVAERILVSYGFIGNADVDEVRELYLRTPEANRPRSFLTFLVMQRRLEKDKAERALQILFEDEVLALFRRKSGSFNFEKMDVSALDVSTGVRRLDCEQIIMEGARRADEWERCLTEIPSFDWIPCLSVVDRHTLLGTNARPMSPKLWKVYSMVNNRRSVHALCRLTGLGEFDTVQALFELMSAKLVHLAQTTTPLENQTPRVMPENTQDTVVSLLGDMVNSYARSVNEPTVLSGLWDDVQGHYPFSDAVFVRNNCIDTGYYVKSFVLAHEDAHLLKRINADVRAALIHLLSRLHHHYALMAGNNVAGKLLKRVFDEHSSREVQLKVFFPDFRFADVVSRVTSFSDGQGQ